MTCSSSRGLAGDGGGDGRVGVAVQRDPPGRDEVEIFAAVGGDQVRAAGTADRDWSGRGLCLGEGVPDMAPIQLEKLLVRRHGAISRSGGMRADRRSIAAASSGSSARQLGQDAHPAEALDGGAVAGIGRAVEHDAGNRQSTRSQRGETEQRVVDRSERAARHQQNGQRQPGHEIDHEVAIVERHEYPAGALDDQRMRGLRQRDRIHRDRDTLEFCRGVRRQRRPQGIDRRVNMLGRQAGERNNSSGIVNRTVVGRAGLHRLPIAGPPCARKAGGGDRLADAGVGAGDEDADHADCPPEAL